MLRDARSWSPRSTAGRRSGSRWGTRATQRTAPSGRSSSHSWTSRFNSSPHDEQWSTDDKGRKTNSDLRKQRDDQELNLKKKDAQGAGLKTGMLGQVKFVYKLWPEKPENLDQAAAGPQELPLRSFRPRGQLNDSLDALSDVEQKRRPRVVRRKNHPKKTRPSLTTLKSGVSTAANRDKARVWTKNISKANTASAFSRDDAKDIADAIRTASSRQRFKACIVTCPGRAVARRGVNLAKMEVDWKATQRFLNTLNGPQQLRLQQVLSALPPMLDKIGALR